MPARDGAILLRHLETAVYGRLVNGLPWSWFQMTVVAYSNAQFAAAHTHGRLRCSESPQLTTYRENQSSTATR